MSRQSSPVFILNCVYHSNKSCKTKYVLNITWIDRMMSKLKKRCAKIKIKQQLIVKPSYPLVMFHCRKCIINLCKYLYIYVQYSLNRFYTVGMWNKTGHQIVNKVISNSYSQKGDRLPQSNILYIHLNNGEKN